MTILESIDILKKLANRESISLGEVRDIIISLGVADTFKGDNQQEMTLGKLFSSQNVELLTLLSEVCITCNPTQSSGLPKVQQYRLICDTIYLMLAHKDIYIEDTHMTSGVKTIYTDGRIEYDGNYADESECIAMLNRYKDLSQKEVFDITAYKALEPILTEYPYEVENWANLLNKFRVEEVTMYMGFTTTDVDKYYDEVELLNVVYDAYLGVLVHDLILLGEKFPSSLVAALPEIRKLLGGDKLYGGREVEIALKGAPIRVRSMYSILFNRDEVDKTLRNIRRLVAIVYCVKYGNTVNAVELAKELKRVGE